jgi:Uma2 family endonuclease
MATAQQALTAEEYARLPDDGNPTELVRGEVVEMNLPKPRHGEVCANIVIHMGIYCQSSKLGRVICNDAGAITERDPDSVRGPDVSYISFDRAPLGPLGWKYLDPPPDVAFEVLSPEDRPGRTLAKIGEYLRAGVTTVVIVDPDEQCVFVHERGVEQKIVDTKDTLVLTTIAPDCAIPVRKFFE